MIIKHASDIHLEFMNFPDFSKEEGGDVLILNGDILVAPCLTGFRTDKNARKLTNYLTDHFIPELINKFPYVLFLCGNHEHYRGDVNSSLDIIRKWFEKQGVKNMLFMENDKVDIGGVRFVGCTLWSDFLGADPVAMWEAGRAMNDFRIVSNGMEMFRPEDALELHKKSLTYIQDASEVDMPVVVATHHTPTSKLLNPFHSGNLLDGAYYTDLSHVMEARPNIKYWVSGHTHAIGEHKIHETICRSNCRGYYTELGFKGWPGLASFEV